MSYRSQRFEPGEQSGIGKAWEIIDFLESKAIPVVDEVMAGRSYKRQLHPGTVSEHGEINYLLQVTHEPQTQEDGSRLHAHPFLDKAVEILHAIEAELPGQVTVDEGGLNGWDITTTTEHIFGTGTTETEVLQVYPPWLQAKWEEAGKQVMFFCGIKPPSPQRILEDWMFSWSERDMKEGRVVFTPTPGNLETW